MFSDDKLVGHPLRQSLLPGAEGFRIFAIRGVVDWLSGPDQYLVHGFCRRTYNGTTWSSGLKDSSCICGD
jgi:hypothetical protein